MTTATAPRWAAALPSALLASAAAGLALALGAAHPLAPGIALAAVALAGALAARWSGATWFVLPAVMPWIALNPWTGWTMVDEFDLLVLALLAGAHAARAAARWRGVTPPLPRREFGVVALLAVLLGFGVVRGWLDAGGGAPSAFDGYTDATNALRAGKSLAFALALWPLLPREAAALAAAARRFALGMALGVAVVGVAALGERIAYPGLLEFSGPYRITARFWEMHVGGAAIDAYLALATPVVAWAVWGARTPVRFAVAALLAVLTVHAALVTFARGVLLAVGLPLLGLGLAWLWQRLGPRAAVPARAGEAASVSSRQCGAPWPRGAVVGFGLLAVVVLVGAFAIEGYAGLGWVWLAASALLLLAWRRVRALGWRAPAGALLALALATEVVAVVAGGSFLVERLAQTTLDAGGRIAHWRHGLGVLDSPRDVALGIGLGRLPARYAAADVQREFSGAIRWVATPQGLRPRLEGPAVVDEIGGLYALTQRVPHVPGARYVVSLQARSQALRAGAAEAPAARLWLRVCERHLLYDARCQEALVTLPPPEAVATLDVPLDGPAFAAQPWWPARRALLSIAVYDAGTAALLERVQLRAGGGADLLHHGDFARGAARWFPSAQAWYVPWHIDNLYLELLIERGAAGALALLALAGLALQRLLDAARHGDTLAPFLAAALAGVALVGAVSSVLDVPRVALVAMLVAMLGLRRGAAKPGTPR
ncbi:hypothetical protein [Azohydromonas sediminis]|uniref:hypothetical protein n=1 Tax=Azohydromonas sediminis TaxID=2259674 RepID=UPI0013C2C4FA|nr:hypothetical protein [Azohydromonas sediminis]